MARECGSRGELIMKYITRDLVEVSCYSLILVLVSHGWEWQGTSSELWESGKLKAWQRHYGSRVTIASSAVELCREELISGMCFRHY